MRSSVKVAVFRAVAGFGSIYHILLGLIGLFGTGAMLESTLDSVYGVNPKMDPQFLYLAKFVSSYILAIGVMLGILAWKPVEYRLLVWPAVTLFGIRIASRLFFFPLLKEAFGVSMIRNLQVLIPVAIMALLLIQLRPCTSLSPQS